ncbi:MAG: chemotaxis response regulator protein-glutamate methylesterase [Deltaproteobacteria bacterium]|nr:chemotaxis response regulator protein-glutamate methylesterase [Deltaproteobacteria bacterium]
MNNKIRVLVVDDSALMRLMISDILNSDKKIEVVATARDGEDGIEKVAGLKPDVVTLDLEMPRLDGLHALGYIMSENPTPVVMISTHTQKDADATFRALEYGAFDFVSKPSGPISGDIWAIGDELIAKVKMAAGVDLGKLKFIRPKKIPEKYLKPKPKKMVSEAKVVAIGASTGGPRALGELLPQLDPDIPAGLLIVQHIATGFTKTFAARLDRESKIEVKEAEAGDRIEQGKALIAPGDYHMTVKRDISGKGGAGIVGLNKGPPVYGLRPTVDAMMLTAAEVYGGRIIGVILTGMGSDGAKGIKAIKENKGGTIAQDRDTCVVYGMPKAAVEAGAVDKVVPLDRIAEEIMKMI